MTKTDLGLNLVICVFTLYLSDLLVGVGSVTALTVKTHSWTVDLGFLFYFLGKPAFKSGRLLLKNTVIFRTCHFPIVNDEIFIPECAYRPWDHFVLLVRNENLWYSSGRIMVYRVFSQNFFLDIFGDFVEGNHLGGGGPLPGPWGARKDMYRTNFVGGGGPLPGP